MTPAVRRAIIVGVVLAAQALAVAAYLRIDGARHPPAIFTFAPLAPSLAPPLLVQRPDGQEQVLAGAGGVRVFHFWATWCPPCREELPGLLDSVAKIGELELFAVSVDPDWEVIRGFFPHGLPASVVKAMERDAHRRYGTRTLPDTYVVSPDGRLVERIAGARDWSTSQARDYLHALPSRLR